MESIKELDKIIKQRFVNKRGRIPADAYKENSIIVIPVGKLNLKSYRSKTLFEQCLCYDYIYAIITKKFSHPGTWLTVYVNDVKLDNKFHGFLKVRTSQILLVDVP